MKIKTRIEVRFTDCIDVLKNELLLENNKFPQEDLIKEFRSLYKDIMKKWIDPEDRCLACGGIGYHDYHKIDTCVACKGTGRCKINKNAGINCDDT